jgi:hypothetical protein
MCVTLIAGNPKLDKTNFVSILYLLESLFELVKCYLTINYDVWLQISSSYKLQNSKLSVYFTD